MVGGAALGVANRLTQRNSKPKVFGARVPIDINPKRFDPSKLVKNIDTKRLTPHVDVERLSKDVSRIGKDVDVKDVLRRIGNLAEQVEARSEDVRSLSAQAKRLTRRLG